MQVDNDVLVYYQFVQDRQYVTVWEQCNDNNNGDGFTTVLYTQTLRGG